MQLKKKHVASLALLGAVVVIGTVIAFVALNMQTSYQMEMRVQVVPGKTGFDLNTSSVRFGTLSPGMSTRKTFGINNSGTRPIRVVVKTTGDLARWVEIDPPTFNVTPQEFNKNYSATVKVPNNALPGNYTGLMTVYVLKT